MYFLMYCGFCIYRLTLMYLLHSTIFSLLITVSNSWSKHSMNDSIVSFVISIYPWCIPTSGFHGDVEVINSNFGKFFWVFQGAIFVNSHTFAWMLLISNVVMMKQVMRTGVRLGSVVNTRTILFFTHTTVIMEVNTRTEVTL